MSDSTTREEELESVCDRVEILNDKGYCIDHEVFTVSYQRPDLNKPIIGESSSMTELSIGERWQIFEQHLSDNLYLRLFCGINSAEAIPSLQEREQFMDGLSAVNTSTNAPDLCWQLLPTYQDDRKVAFKNGVNRLLLEGTFTVRKGQSQFVDFLRAAESRRHERDYYHARSDVYFPQDEELFRIYWSIAPECVAPLLEALTQQLNHYKVPFRFKCLNHPALYNRLNSAILFINKRDFHLVKRLIMPMAVKFRDWLKKPLPIFCKELFQGVAIAEGPGPDQSFGRTMMYKVARRKMAMHWDRLNAEEDHPQNPFMKFQTQTESLILI